jgi:two-component system chemotaxis response regulator CheY
MKALVVDDDLTTRIVLEEILSGYAEVDTCVDGDEAVLAYRRELERGAPYDLICMDVLMPKMNGIETLNLIRREEELDPVLRPRHTKVIMTTGSDDKSTIDQAFQRFCDAYVIKPIDTEEFNGVVECLFPIQRRA